MLADTPNAARVKSLSKRRGAYGSISQARGNCATAASLSGGTLTVNIGPKGVLSSVINCAPKPCNAASAASRCPGKVVTFKAPDGEACCATAAGNKSEDSL